MQEEKREGTQRSNNEKSPLTCYHTTYILLEYVLLPHVPLSLEKVSAGEQSLNLLYGEEQELSREGRTRSRVCTVCERSTVRLFNIFMTYTLR
jgi:hypothetical protein